MIILRSLTVKGFRAYTEEKEFVFDNPTILFLGENHRGKSSTLNSIEWCLFGSDCIGAGTGIRERIDWEIPNRNMHPPDVSVRVKLKDDTAENEFTITRKWLSTRKDELEVILPDGRALRGHEAREKFAQLLQSSFRDFLTTVYQHQEAIRAVLTQEPRERNDAIDRLLGLSDYRNILSGIEAAKLPRKQKKMVDDFDGFAREIGVALRTREIDLKEKRQAAAAKGLEQDCLNENGAFEIAKKIKKELCTFASETGLCPKNLQIPKQWQQLYVFGEAVAADIRRFRSEMPGVKEQQSLYARRTEITALKVKHEHARKTLNDNYRKIEDFVREFGDEESLKKRKVATQQQVAEKKKELKNVNARAVVINDAIDCIKLEVGKKGVCPVCGKETPDLLEHLEKEWKEKYETQMRNLQNEIRVLEDSLSEFEELQTKHNKLKKDFESAKNETEKDSKEVATLLSREISAKDDCGAILSGELEKIGGRLNTLEQGVKKKQQTLDQISSLVEDLRLVTEILTLERKKKIVEHIQESPEYNKMEELKDQMAVLIVDVERIKQAISEASREVAQEKVAVAGARIDDYFRRISNNPAVTKVKFQLDVDSRAGLNSYMFTDQDGKDLTPVLSQGDLNAMALSIFLGMACSKQTNQRLGFVILDDPSQSLSFGYKERLVEILNEVLTERMVILASMDKELQDLALLKITKAKTIYLFNTWSPERGPQVSREMV
jgi:DNA repair exonuclease SbcCD ATPase subunit